MLQLATQIVIEYHTDRRSHWSRGSFVCLVLRRGPFHLMLDETVRPTHLPKATRMGLANLLVKCSARSAI